MKRLPVFIVAIAVGFSFNSYAQSDFVVTGSNQSGTTGSVSLSVGQVVYTNESSSAGSVNNGVHQVYAIEVIDGIEIKEIDLKLTAFPNPTADNLWLKIDSEIEKPMTYVILENTGKIIAESEISSAETEINMRDLASGSYYLIIKQEQSKIKTFKIQKSN